MPKIKIPVTISSEIEMDIPAEWADIFNAIDEAKKVSHVSSVMAPTAMPRTIAEASARKLTPMPAAVLDRLEQGGNRFVSIKNLKKHIRTKLRKVVSTGSIHQLVHLLRKEHEFEIETHPEYGGGYRLLKEVS
tara:strand:+ start:3949 stop:4347 length:399 start_codon:yes stop_codon:yes gene_type:complete